jgi:DNA-binding response OmpR family regulator
VDDEEMLLRLFKRTLESTGRYVVATEKNGALALHLAQNFKPQMIFIDISMPEIEGSALAHEIRSHADFKQIPIVFLTGSVSPEEVGVSGGKIGGEFFLAKPVDPKQLLKCVEAHLP